MRPEATVEHVSDTLARFIVEPLERGYGQTLGNSMRRVLLSSLDGAAATSVNIEGVQHEFSSIEGIIEDVTDIVLNVKGLVFSPLGTGEEAVATVSAAGPALVTGADLQVPSEFSLINPEHVIATLSEGGHLEMSMHIGVGRGYISAERNKRADDPIGLIPVDSLYSPVRRCTMDVTDTRVGQRTDYDRLVLEVETNGAISPEEAIVRAADIIHQHMDAFTMLSGDFSVGESTIFTSDDTGVSGELDRQVEDLDLSVRSYNCLKRAGIHTVRQLVGYSENDLMNIRNFGTKSIEEVKDKLHTMDLDLKL
jgi:DNA-directed RNA polymerase subunit alpha